MADIAQGSDRDRILVLQAGAHVMTLGVGLFCIFHAPDQPLPGPSGLPGVRVSRAPSASPDAVEVITFEGDGWIGGANGAALVRIKHPSAGVLITTYHDPEKGGRSPRLQVMRLSRGKVSKGHDVELSGDGVDGERDASHVPGSSHGYITASDGADPDINLPAHGMERQGPEGYNRKGQAEAVEAELSSMGGGDIQAHIQRQGDCSVDMGQWIGRPGSQQWIEGFAINPVHDLRAEDIEYQAVLGRGWLSPWVEGGQFCGSRGMSLPVLGLHVRLREEVKKAYKIRVSASFIDGTRVGPLEEVEAPLEADSHAPLEAFRLEIEPRSGRRPKAEAAARRTEQGVAPAREESVKAESEGAASGRIKEVSQPASLGAEAGKDGTKKADTSRAGAGTGADQPGKSRSRGSARGKVR